ncbi:MAG TPA: hypothetical protein VFA38_01450 [Nitrospirales bacterium]|nr:hypothetical protein [Nitrospirales bacterium]
MRALGLALAGLALSVLSVSASTPPSPVDSQRLAELTRALEDEVKLAARPQVYLVFDPFDRAILVKSRGLELHRFPVLEWRGPDPHRLAGVFQLKARPPVSRPKAAPVDDPEQLAVIELKDMPSAYELHMDPGLLILIAPPASDHPVVWAFSQVREWWWRLLAVLHVGGRTSVPRIRVTLEEDAARSLAWSVTEQMPLLIGRTRES